MIAILIRTNKGHGHEGHAAGLAGGFHVGAGVLVNVAEGRRDRDEREVHVAKCHVLHEGHFLGQCGGFGGEADLDLRNISVTQLIVQLYAPL